jgi:Protein of unknown function (DUF3306)
MSEPENFVARWSRRKREAAQDAEASKPAAGPEAAPEGAQADDDQLVGNTPPLARGDTSAPPQSVFDPSKLPPIESITAESDIRAFLAPGVPPELTRAALRRAWVADPKVRDFVGLADYDWDFNTPGAVAGFGALEPSEELRQQVARLVGRSLAEDETERPAPTSAERPQASPSVETPNESQATLTAVPTSEEQSNRGIPDSQPDNTGSDVHNSLTILQRGKENVALQSGAKSPDEGRSTAKRSHGSAVPK